jgi:ABC-2 type transport system permease protein/sodium transport system permease protein
VIQVVGLLMLFATFFSAVLLALCSCARSFKEAQAYLIPLMMVSIAPGLLSLAPGLDLEGALSSAPVVNIVLLGRDLLEHHARGSMALVVVVSTLLYALAAVALAARLFAAESVLYSTESGWADLLRRPREAQPAASAAAALGCLALVFPAFFLSVNAIADFLPPDISVRLGAAAAATALVFAALPLAWGWWGRVSLVDGFALRLPQAGRFLGGQAMIWLAAALFGLCLWPLAHEVVVLQMDLGLVQLSEEQVRMATDAAKKLRGLPAAYVLLAMAVMPAVCEELLFRGYLFAALRPERRPWFAILTAAVAFGAFHLVTPTGILFAKLLPSTLLGIVLGWVRWRSGSVLPAMLLHACHNGIVTLLLLYQGPLADAGVAVEEQSHLPLLWIAASAGAALIAAGLLRAATRQAPVATTQTVSV